MTRETAHACARCGANMLQTFDRDVHRNIWHCLSCGHEEIPDMEPANSRNGPTTIEPRTPQDAPLAGVDWKAAALSRLRALITEVPAKTRSVESMKREAELTRTALLLFDMEVPELPWKGAKKVPVPGRRFGATATVCSRCGKSLEGKRPRKTDTVEYVCWRSDLCTVPAPAAVPA